MITIFANYPDVLEVKDICALLRIGRVQAYELLNSGVIPYRRIGRIYKVRKEALIEYLRSA